jgi:RNA polymerase sigma-70 factor (ECF subfamily)
MIGALNGQQIAMTAGVCAKSADHAEAQWIVRAKTADPAAFQWLLDRYRASALRLAAHVLRSESESEDIAQEAFIRAFRSVQNLRGDGGFGPWLYRIVLRLCLDRRRLKRWDEVPTSNLCDLSDMSDPSDRSDHSDGFSAAVDRRVVVEALLDRLSPQMRAALILRELEGLEYEEIAQVLAIPVGTVRSRLHAARAQFRALWTAASEEDDHV